MQKLVGKKITVQSLEELAPYLKGEFQSYDEKTDTVSVELDDTNLPYLWSVEGIARVLKGVLKVSSGLSKIKVKKAKYNILVESSVSSVRPFISAFVAKGKVIDDYLLKQLVQLQEKFCDGYGRRRQKVSIGLYSYKRIKFPVHYKAVSPGSVKFVPLGMNETLSLSDILEKHPKGKEYAWILKGFKSYPILMDDKDEVLSFPPIINSDVIGKIEVGDSDLFFEVTGTDNDAVMLATNIFSYAMFERGFEIYSVDIKSGKGVISTPSLAVEKIRIKKEDVRGLLGLDLDDSEVKSLLERAGYGFNNYVVSIPPYRGDIMHAVDVIEDIAIMFGFHNIPLQELESYTVGHKLPMNGFVDMVRDTIVGLGYQEVFSPILSNKSVLFDRMNLKGYDVVEIDNFMSESFSAVRSWILPVLLEMLSKNKHVDFPQRVFEEGLATVREGEKIADCRKVAFISTHSSVDFNESKQSVEYLLRQLGFKFELRELECGSFTPGRCAEIIIDKNSVGFFGELNPQVLSNWGLEMPAVAAEINLSLLFGLQKN